MFLFRLASGQEESQNVCSSVYILLEFVHLITYSGPRVIGQGKHVQYKEVFLINYTYAQGLKC